MHAYVCRAPQSSTPATPRAPEHSFEDWAYLLVGMKQLQLISSWQLIWQAYMYISRIEFSGSYDPSCCVQR